MIYFSFCLFVVLICVSDAQNTVQWKLQTDKLNFHDNSFDIIPGTSTFITHQNRFFFSSIYNPNLQEVAVIVKSNEDVTGATFYRLSPDGQQLLSSKSLVMGGTVMDNSRTIMRMNPQLNQYLVILELSEGSWKYEGLLLGKDGEVVASRNFCDIKECWIEDILFDSSLSQWFLLQSTGNNSSSGSNSGSGSDYQLSLNRFPGTLQGAMEEVEAASIPGTQQVAEEYWSIAYGWNEGKYYGMGALYSPSLEMLSYYAFPQQHWGSWNQSFHHYDCQLSLFSCQAAFLSSPQLPHVMMVVTSWNCSTGILEWKVVPLSDPSATPSQGQLPPLLGIDCPQPLQGMSVVYEGTLSSYHVLVDLGSVHVMLGFGGAGNFMSSAVMLSNDTNDVTMMSCSGASALMISTVSAPSTPPTPSTTTTTGEASATTSNSGTGGDGNERMRMTLMGVALVLGISFVMAGLYYVGHVIYYNRATTSTGNRGMLDDDEDLNHSMLEINQL